MNGYSPGTVAPEAPDVMATALEGFIVLVPTIKSGDTPRPSLRIVNVCVRAVPDSVQFISTLQLRIT